MLKIFLAVLMTGSPTPDPSIQLEQQLAQDLTVTNSQIAIIARQLDGLKLRMDLHRAETGKIASAAYKQERSAALNSVVNASTPKVLLERLLLISSLARARERDFAALEQETERYQSVQRTLEALQEQQRTQRQALLSARLKRQASINR